MTAGTGETRRRLRVAIVGLGFGERVLVPAFRSDPRCEIAGVCARREDRAREAAARLGVPRAFASWRDAIAHPGVDALAIATPPAAQPEIALAAIRAGRHVFCEKPLATCEAEAAALRDAAAEAGVAGMIDFEFPEIPAWQRARELVASGRLGPLREVVVSWHSETRASRQIALRRARGGPPGAADDETPDWKTQPAAGGGALNAFASHCFHYLEWLLPPVRALWTPPFAGDAADSLVLLALELADGTHATVSIGTAAFLGDGHAITCYGEAGTLRLANRTDDLGTGFELALGTRGAGALERVPVAPLAPIGDDGRVPLVARLVQRFADWALEGTPARPDLSDGVRVQALLDAAWRARRAPHSGAVRRI
ncbi:MAG: Gfo/Idh/MocA family oxidoreductase [Acidobacteria bacterium]|nr:Gfo/Idh/MocA family oxidoreductase [Acidobacteriota bacterium]